MSRYHSYLNSAREILSTYQGSEPFASFIKKYFASFKKYGSTDRKQISQLCYTYFRLGKAGSAIPIEEKILIAFFLCTDKPTGLLESIRPDWNEKIALPIAEKLTWLNTPLLLQDIFPWTDELSLGIDRDAFILSHLKQPDLFLRLRPGKEEKVKQKLQQGNITFKIMDDHCLALPNGTKIETIIEPDAEAVVQDYSSQRTGIFLQSSLAVLQSAWDCCAGSGGKSIMLNDLYPGIHLIVSDTRESILINLEKRFKKAGIVNYKSFFINLKKPPVIPGSPFNFILADIPCSGSGTWSRTPEQLYYFDDRNINEYSLLQQKILSDIVPQIEENGHLFYITCSVFKKENEEIVDFLQEKCKLQLLKMEWLKGYDQKADTLFAALLKK